MPFIVNQIDGGLDLVTPPVSVSPGRLQDCENFEVAINQGVKSIDGFERFDGGTSPSGINRLWVCHLTSVVVGDFIAKIESGFYVGGYLDLPYSYEGVGQSPLQPRVFYTEMTGASTANVYVATENSEDSQILSLLVGNAEEYELLTGAGIFNPGGSFFSIIVGGIEENAELSSVSASLASKATYYNIVRGTIQEVPGQGNVLGLFWLKDELYACRDYFALAYNLPTSTPSPNDELYIGASYATATWKGFLVKQEITDATGQVGNYSGTMMFYNTTGTATTGTIYNHSQSDTAVATVTSVSAASTAAGLYRADGTRGDTVATQSWTHQDLGYRCQYKEGAAAFVPANRVRPTTDITDLIQATNWVVPDTIKETGNAWIQGGTWSAFPSADGLHTNDGDTSYFGCTHTAEGQRNPFWVNNFGLSDTDIPDGSTVTGFTVEVCRRAYKTGTLDGDIREYFMQLKFATDSGVTGTGIGPGFANTNLNWPESSVDPDNALYATVEYGGAKSLLGYGGVSPDDVKTTDFGFTMGTQLFNATGSGSMQSRVTMVRIKVHFVPPQSKIYFWNGTSGVVAEVVMPYQTSGSVSLSTAKGHLFLMNVGTSRAVGADEQIRTYPGDGVTLDGGTADGSTLIAKTQTAVEKNVMDWSALLTGQGKNPIKSKYQYVTGNFYAAADFDAIYGVSGAGPAFMYDGFAFTRIYTGTPEQDDIPRHACIHQSRLFLGYRSGSVQFSVAGNPLSFDPLNFAGEIGVGSSVRGLMELNGDTLAELTQAGVSMIQGDVGLSPYPGIISPDVGCVEYTAQSMGQFMYTSFRGVQNLRATQSYGDFDTSQFSWDVWSFLRPRVQTSAFFESGPIGVINSLAVRNKSQYRLIFADGKQLTATFLREGEMPQYTIQSYKNASGQALTWDVVTSGVESNGRDRLFGATNDNTGYVYEIDRGYSFDGAAITGHVTLVFDDQRTPYQNKLFTDCQVYGIATDYATFTMSRAANYGEPDPAIFYTHTFGSLTAVPTGEENYFTSATPVRISGRNISLRFDVSSSIQPPVTIQAIAFYVVPSGEKRT